MPLYLDFADVLDAATLKSISKKIQEMDGVTETGLLQANMNMIDKSELLVRSIKTNLSYFMDLYFENNCRIARGTIIKLDTICFFLLVLFKNETLDSEQSECLPTLRALIERMRVLINISPKKIKLLDGMSCDKLDDVRNRKASIIRSINELEELYRDLL